MALDHDDYGQSTHPVEKRESFHEVRREAPPFPAYVECSIKRQLGAMSSGLRALSSQLCFQYPAAQIHYRAVAAFRAIGVTEFAAVPSQKKMRPGTGSAPAG